MNHYAYYGLKCEDADFAYSKPVEGLSFCGAAPFTFSCDFYFEKGFSGNLFFQEESVVCEVKNNYVQWRSQNGNTVKSDSLSSPLLEQAWNHIDVVSSGDSLILYVNRMQADKAAPKRDQICPEANYQFGQYYPGYLRNIRIADFAFSQEDVMTYSAATTPPSERLLLYIPFDTADVCDQGKYHLPVICMGLARSTSLIQALFFEKPGFASIQHSSINPGSAALPEFSIATRVFLYPKAAEGIMLFCNWATQEKDLLAIGLNMTMECAYLTMQIGNTTYLENQIAIPYFQWVDLCITLHDCQVSCYVNGAQSKALTLSQKYVRTGDAQIILGDHSMEPEKFFCGAIDYFAVYQKALTAEYVQQIASVEPYLFDEGICSFFLLHGESSQDLVGNGILTLGNVEISMMEGTVAERTIAALTYRCNDHFSGNELEKWETELVLNLCAGTMAAVTGLKTAQTIPLCVQQALVDEIAVMPEAQKLFMEYDAIQAEDALCLVEKLFAKPKTVNIISSLFAVETAALSAATVAACQKYLEMETILTTATFFTLLTTAVVATIARQKPKDPPPIPPDIPKWGYTVSLQSVQFCNGTEGSVPLRRSFTQAQTLPEWTANRGDIEQIAYLARHQSRKLWIKFSYLPAKDQASAEVTIKGISPLFGDFKAEPVHCTAAGTYETTAVLNNMALKEQNSLGCISHAVKWSYNSWLGVESFWGSITLKTHIIWDNPLAPWSLTDESHYPTVELLELANTMRNKQGNINSFSGFAEAMYTYFHSDGRIKFKAKDAYSAISDTSVDELTISNVQLTQALLQGGAELSALDICSFGKYMAAMEGFDVQVFGFFGFEYPISTKSKTVIGSCGLWLCAVEAFGEDVTNQLARHYVLGNGKCEKLEDSKVYDLTLNLKGDQSYLGNIALTNYRNKIARSPDELEIGYIGYHLNESSQAVTCDIQIAYDPDNDTFISTKRMDFKAHIKQLHQYPGNLACCHRLSYAVMERILLDTFNRLKDDESFDQNMKNAVLDHLFNAFYESGAFEGQDSLNRNQLAQHLEELKTATKEDMQASETCAEAGTLLSSALYCLNSAQINLRDGYSNWNSSIGDAYDPSTYTVAFTQRGTCYCVNQSGEIGTLAAGTTPGVYIQSPEDKQILTHIYAINGILNSSYITLYQSFRLFKGQDNWWYSIPFVYSSNNLIPFLGGNTRSAVMSWFV